MPLYDYGCQEENCEHIWEVFHKMAESGPTECPQCQSNNVRKLISAVHGSVQLSGDELKQKIKQDARKLSQEAASKETVMADLVGYDKMQGNAVLRDKIKKEL